MHRRIGTPTRPYRTTAIVLLLGFLLLFPLVALFGAAMGAVGVGLLALAVRQRDLTLGVVATVFGTVGVMQSMHIVSNAVWHLTGVSISSSTVIGVLALGILATSLVTRRREHTPA